MSEFRFKIERVEEGHVRVEVYDEIEESGAECLVWACSVNQEYTQEAQKAALKATFTYLNGFLDLSEGGRY